MTKEQFLQIFKPLMERHPVTFAAPVMAEEIFKFFSCLEIQEGQKAITKLMLQSRMAPVEQDFRDVTRIIKDERPKRLQIESKENSIFSDDEKTELFKFVKAAATGQLSRQEVEEQAKMIQKIIDDRKRCRVCDDGFVFAKDESNPNASDFVFLCHCSMGQRRNERYPRWGTSFSTSRDVTWTQ